MGALRFFLALCVVAFHLTSPSLAIVGPLAVNFFYVISGFLITMILNETYNFSFPAFALNRVIRLYPAYAVTAVATIVLLYLNPSAHAFNWHWTGQINPGDILGNVFIIPWSVLSDPMMPDYTGLGILRSPTIRFQLIPIIWSIAIELSCYLVLFLFAARNARRAAIVLFLAMAWQLTFTLRSPASLMIYMPIPAAMLPFSLGAIAYFMKGIAPKPATDSGLIARCFAVAAVFLVNWGLDYPSSVGSPSYWTNYIIAFAGVLLIQTARPNNKSFHSIDRFLGDISYPLFLCHYVATAITFYAFGGTSPAWGWHMFAIGIAPSLAMAATINLLIDRQLVSLRGKVRGETLAPSRSSILATERPILRSS
jgi:peptidoglycan/LPS O-acetylase OafA/YrhL